MFQGTKTGLEWRTKQRMFRQWLVQILSEGEPPPPPALSPYLELFFSRSADWNGRWKSPSTHLVSPHYRVLPHNKVPLLRSPNVNRRARERSGWSQLQPHHIPNAVCFQRGNASLGSKLGCKADRAAHGHRRFARRRPEHAPRLVETARGSPDDRSPLPASTSSVHLQNGASHFG